MGRKEKSPYRRVTHVVGNAKFTIEEMLGIECTYRMYIPIKEEAQREIIRICLNALARAQRRKANQS